MSCPKYTPPGYAPCTRDPSHDGPCAHPYDWKKRLKHERDKRDGYVLCGNTKPSRPDPEGGLVEVAPRRFNGKVFFEHMEKNGHDSVNFQGCRCQK